MVMDDRQRRAMFAKMKGGNPRNNLPRKINNPNGLGLIGTVINLAILLTVVNAVTRLLKNPRTTSKQKKRSMSILRNADKKISKEKDKKKQKKIADDAARRIKRIK